MSTHTEAFAHARAHTHTRTASAAFALVSALGDVTEALEWEEDGAGEEKVACGWVMGQDDVLYPNQ